MQKQVLGIVATGVLSMACITTAHASLSTLKSYVGNYSVSTSGWGSTSQAGTLTANVPKGATVEAAYLYTSAHKLFKDDPAIGGSFQAQPVTYKPLGELQSSGNFLEAGRADVTKIVAPIINGGIGGSYSFSITETSKNQDGSALVVVYRLPSLPVSTVAILDGFSATTGDTTSLNFADPINVATTGFFAEMRLGIGFSCCNQASQVSVNGKLITENAGNNDDSADSSFSDGNLITVGDDNDPFSPYMPTYQQDHERYNLVPYVATGDRSIKIDTLNPSGDDNIFLAVFHVYGRAGVNTQPPTTTVPSKGAESVPSLSLSGVGLLALLLGGANVALQRKRRFAEKK